MLKNTFFTKTHLTAPTIVLQLRLFRNKLTYNVLCVKIITTAKGIVCVPEGEFLL